MFELATVAMSPLSQILAVIVGLVLMIGAYLFYSKHHQGDEPVIAFWLGLGGFVITVWGIGGQTLLNAIFK